MDSTSKSDAVSARQKRHVVLFPFMSKGHIIPLLRLARLLLRRRHISVTFFTTAANRPFIADSLSDTSAAVVSIPFPYNLPGIPAGVESTDRLPSMSLFTPFAEAIELLKPHFEQALQNLLPRVSLLVSDGFLWWTLDSAAKFGIPRPVSYGMPTYAMVLTRLAIRHGLLHGMKVGLRVERNCNGFVEREEVKKKVKELMEGEEGKEVRKKVKEVGDMARKAMEEGGSSWLALESLINEPCA